MTRADVEVRRSKRRRRTVSAYREGERIVVLIPASLTRKEEAEWVETMVARIEKAEQKSLLSDDDLLERALQLSDRWLGGAGHAGERALGDQPELPLGVLHAG